MTLFHLNPANGYAGICHDSSRNCPIGKDNHFTSLAAVAHALEIGDFSQGPDEEIVEAFAKLKESLDSPLVHRRVVERVQTDLDYGAYESSLLILLGKALLVDSATEEGDQLRSDKEKLLGEISDAYFIRNSLSSDERAIMDNLIDIKNLWLKDWS